MLEHGGLGTGYGLAVDKRQVDRAVGVGVGNRRADSGVHNLKRDLLAHDENRSEDKPAPLLYSMVFCSSHYSFSVLTKLIFPPKRSTTRVKLLKKS